MSSLSSLVSGVAHEINNPNNLVMLNCTFLMKVWEEVIPILDKHNENQDDFSLHNLPYSDMREEFIHLLSSILTGAERIKTTVASLRQFVSADAISTDQKVDISKTVDFLILLALIKSKNQLLISLLILKIRIYL